MSADPDADFQVYRSIINDLVLPLHREVTGVEFPNAIQVVSTGIPTPDAVTLSCTTDEKTIEDFLYRAPGRPPRLNQGEYQTVTRLHAGDPTVWYMELNPRSGEGDATVPKNGANGTHSGGPYPQIAVTDVPHADMLMDVGVQWKIKESIEEKLDGLIEALEDTLRERT